MLGGSWCIPGLLGVLPLAESFLVLMILAAYSWPVQSLTQRRTTEKAPLGRDRLSTPQSTSRGGQGVASTHDSAPEVRGLHPQ